MAKQGITTKATLKGLNVGKPDYNGKAKITASVEFEIERPAKVESFDEWASGYAAGISWQDREKRDELQRRIKSAHKAAEKSEDPPAEPAKAKKGKSGKTPAEHKAENVEKLQEQLDQLDQRLQGAYAEAVTKMQRRNSLAMNRAQTITMLMLLQGQECTVSITPAQQNMFAMLGPGDVGDGGSEE